MSHFYLRARAEVANHTSSARRTKAPLVLLHSHIVHCSASVWHQRSTPVRCAPVNAGETYATLDAMTDAMAHRRKRVDMLMYETHFASLVVYAVNEAM